MPDGIDLITKTPDMGFSVPGVTSGNMPPVLQDPQYQAATKRLGELREKETRLTQEKADWQRKKDPELTRLEEMQTAAEKELKAPPQYTPDKIDPADAVVWGLVAALGGLATRNPAMNAMNALSAAAMAHQKGHAEQFDQAVKAYHEQADYALKKGESIQRQYQSILKDRQLTLEGKQAELEALGSQIKMTDDARGDIEKIYDQFQKHQQQLKDAELADARLKIALGRMKKIGEEEAGPADVTKTLVDPKSRQYFQLEKGTLRPYRIESGQKVYATPDEQQRLRRVSDVETTERGEEKRKAKLETSYPKAKAAVTSMSESLQDSIDNIDRLLKDPEGIEAITGKTGAAYKDLPDWMKAFWPTAARAQSALNQINARAIFDELSKMRQQSPTGGALGQVTEKEEAYLKSAAAQLDQAQSTQDFTAALERFKRQVRSSKENVETAFQETFESKMGDEAKPELTSEDQDAVNWAKSNPNDPRARKILQMHGM